MNIKNVLVRCGAPALALALAAGSAPGHAGPVETTTGTVLRLLADVSGLVTSPVGDLLVGVTQNAGNLLAHTTVRIQGRYLLLARGTAAFDMTFTHDGQQRRVLIVRPQTAVAGAPMLLMLHGNGGTAENQANLAEAPDLVAAQGLWVVLPEALNGTWNDDPANSIGIDDTGFLADVVQILTVNFAADASRIYVSGLSNGAFMAERFACERSDLLAAAALISGTISGGLMNACSPATPRPIMFMDGSADPIVPYDGSRLGVRSAPDTFAFWLSRLNCSAAQTMTTALPDTTVDGTTVALARNTGCGSGGEVRLYTVNGGGHAWPGGWQYLPVPIIGRTSTDIDATDEIWSFVSAYRR
ncbi:alpha/beta hydrolase family esterase [Solimonas soli]|uniref:alpha/beta hydrolase family esterase n=1 Tax=Solimonas soli TaxID=413479 RepID=UPI0004B3ED48|nr:PHB depolymerase family esterase [Solimonas soli]